AFTAARTLLDKPSFENGMYPRIGPGPTRGGRHNGLGSCAEESVEWTIEPFARDIGSHGRKSILQQRDNQQECLIFQPLDLIRGRSRWTAGGRLASRPTSRAPPRDAGADLQVVPLPAGRASGGAAGSVPGPPVQCYG